MKLAHSTQNRTSRKFVTLVFVALFLFSSAFVSRTYAQAEQLSLADVLIALRSKKATLPERNKILAEAVRQRGITFAVAPQIEKELSLAGADAELLSAIREKGVILKASAVQSPPPDADFYQKRGNNNAAKGDFSAAVTDFNIAAELDPDEPSIYMDRGSTHFNLKEFAKAVEDYDKAIELDPTLPKAFFSRALSSEMIGNIDSALADFKKTVELDPSNMAATASIGRIEAAIAAKNPKPVEKPVEKIVEPAKTDASASVPPVVVAGTNNVQVETETATRPEFMNIGLLSESDARRMVTPIYSAMAQKVQVFGKVTVEVELNEEGDVTNAKATDGPKLLRNDAENAARRSKFNPILWNGLPIKAKGYIIYNFTRGGREE